MSGCYCKYCMSENAQRAGQPERNSSQEQEPRTRMKNATLKPREHTASVKDAFGYWLIGKLGSVQKFLYEHVICEPVWRSFDGSVHVPRTMTDRHLFNCMQLCLREGEITKPIFRALKKEYDRREVLRLKEHIIELANIRSRETENSMRRKIALDNSPPFMTLPIGWSPVTEPDHEDSRAYNHASGAKVSLSAEGYWLWFKANRHHIRCNDKNDSLFAAMEAALRGEAHE